MGRRWWWTFELNELRLEAAKSRVTLSIMDAYISTWKINRLATNARGQSDMRQREIEYGWI